ncbi:MAG TPA: S1/P1 nuclease [Candidatus Ozemobacteraceae bacterium]|nr:S1/P1 nuclease [Candidatus Ozemobacteraceae bacterium]
MVILLLCGITDVRMAGAWSGPGHRIIAILAADLLRTDRPIPGISSDVADAKGAYVEAMRLLSAERRPATLVSVAGWADHVRPQRPETEHYHYVEIPFDAPGYDERRDAPNGDFIVNAFLRMQNDVGNTEKSERERREALKFLVHIVGDLHQPLHCIDRGDAGGNTTIVELNGEKMKLHHVWDFRIVESFGMNEKQIARMLLEKILATDTAALATGTVTDWVNESHALGHEWGYSYQPGFVISSEWLARVRPVAEMQLMRAGVRLARVLKERLRPATRQELIERLRRSIKSGAETAGPGKGTISH